MHSQLIFLMRTCLFFNRIKGIAVTPGITGETISSCRRPLLFGSRALCETKTSRQAYANINNREEQARASGIGRVEGT